MAVQGLEDAEADLAGAIRRLVGPRCLMTTGQDLHGNVSARLVRPVFPLDPAMAWEPDVRLFGDQ